MSTGLNCEMVEPTPGEWYYVLEHGDAPKITWDWREYATAYGPFKSYAWACRHLRDCHANPGGHSIISNDRHKSDPVVDKLIAEAPRATSDLNKMRWPWCDDPYEGIDDPDSD